MMRPTFIILTLFCAIPASADVGGIDVYAEGARLHLLVGQRGEKDGAPAVEYLRSDDGGASWSKAAAISKPFPAPYRVETGDLQVAARGKTVLAVWSAKGDGPMGSGPIIAVRSTDGGKTWKRAASPAGDDLKQGMRFVDLAADGSGAFHAVWLDRKSSAELRYARSSADGKTWTKPRVLDKDTCECCWNTVAAGTRGEVLALYRAKDPRDMALFISKDGGKSWGGKAYLGGFNWRVNMCPHAGGGLAVSKTAVQALVWTGDDKNVGLYHLASADGTDWSKPRKLGDDSAKHSDIAATDERVVAVWDGTLKGESAVFASRSNDGGKSWSEAQPVSNGARSAYPRVVATPAGFRAFWLEKRGDETRWTSAAL